MHSDSDSADYVPEIYSYPVGAGASDQTSFNVDTKVGVQADWKMTDRVNVVGQALSKKRPEGDWAPQVEAAYVKFQAMPELALRAGRIRQAFYMLTDSLDVNYANPWIRPPVEFYGTAPVPHMEGVDVLWRPTTGQLSWLIQPYAGQTTVDIKQDVRVPLRDLFGLNVAAELGNFSARANYIQTEVVFRGPGPTAAINGLLAFCSGGDDIACTKAAKASNPAGSSFIAIGATWDNGDYFLSGELGRRKSEGFLADLDAWYLSAGKRIGKWTPYVTYASGKNKSPKVFGDPTISMRDAIVTALLQSNQMDQATVTLGLRFDVARNIALKAQWDHVKTDCGSTPGTCGGQFVNVSPSFKDNPQSVNLIGISVDFLF